MSYRVILLFSCCILLAACYKDSDYNENNQSQYDNTIQMYIDTTSIPADSFHIAHVYVDLPYDADSTKVLVTYRTDLGIFVESGAQLAQVEAKQNVDSVKRIAIATLRSGTRTGIAHIQINIYTQYQELLDTFVNAYPDYMQFSASTLLVSPADDATGQVGFTCQLFRYQGSPSQLNEVVLTVADSNYEAYYGEFSLYNDLSGPSGNTQFTWVLGDAVLNGGVQYTGLLHALAKVAEDDKGDTISSTITLVSATKTQ